MKDKNGRLIPPRHLYRGSQATFDLSKSPKAILKKKQFQINSTAAFDEDCPNYLHDMRDAFYAKRNARICIEGNYFENRKEAAIETGMDYVMMCNRIASDDWPEWREDCEDD